MRQKLNLSVEIREKKTLSGAAKRQGLILKSYSILHCEASTFAHFSHPTKHFGSIPLSLLIYVMDKDGSSPEFAVILPNYCNKIREMPYSENLQFSSFSARFACCLRTRKFHQIAEFVIINFSSIHQREPPFPLYFVGIRGKT